MVDTSLEIGIVNLMSILIRINFAAVVKFNNNLTKFSLIFYWDFAFLIKIRELRKTKIFIKIVFYFALGKQAKLNSNEQITY